MRFMLMHRTNSHWEAGAIPSVELITRVGEMLGEMSASGTLLAAEGLRPSSLGVRLTFVGGERTLTKGPLVGSNELPASFMILRVPSIAEAIDWASRYGQIFGNAEIDIRPVTEPWDLGMCPRPADATTIRFMAVHKASRDSEAGVPQTVAQRNEVEELIGEMRSAGVLIAAEKLQPSSQGVRFKFSAGKYTMTDGPFTETKELIAGFVILRADSLSEAAEWSPRYAAAVGDIEFDIRPLCEAAPGEERSSPHGNSGDSPARRVSHD
jgi:hypothetical protein